VSTSPAPAPPPDLRPGSPPSTAPSAPSSTAPPEVRKRRSGGGPARVAIWLFHLALPMAGLWLLLAVPEADVHLEHHPAHFWLVFLAAVINIGLAVQVDRSARRHGDARLLLVGLGFLAAALFLGLHALATPGVLLNSRNGGFALATPVGLAVAAAFSAWSTADFDGPRGPAVLRAAPVLRWALLGVTALWGVVSLAGLPPLADPAMGDAGGPVLTGLVVVAVPLYLVAAIRTWLRYRRRRSAVLLSLLTANALLAEATLAVALGVSWQLTWWLWHVLMVFAFGYVAYSAYIAYRKEGSSAGLFDAAGTEQTVAAIRSEYGSALEALVAAVERQAAGELTADEMALITAGLADRFGLSEGQTEVLGRAAGALRNEREQVGRLDVLVAIGHDSRVILTEHQLLARAIGRAAGFGSDSVRIGLLDQGRLEFPPELCTDPGWMPDDSVVARLQRTPNGGMAAVELTPGLLACPLTVKERTAGWLLAQRSREFGDRDRSLFASLASQLSMGLENARLYHQLDGLFRQYMSPDVATALIADPRQAALGGAVVEVTSVFADLRGFTTFSEQSSPEQIVAMLNRYFAVATSAILAEGGTVVQFVGDAMMALFNAPVRQSDHAERAARAALALQSRIVEVAEPGWPRFRVGVNTGPALVGNIGSDELRNFNAMGDAVNVAARLETTAEPGQVLIGDSTCRRLPRGAVTRPLGELLVKGRQQPVVAHQLISLP
jgi:class 3 adenylate cyclase